MGDVQDVQPRRVAWTQRIATTVRDALGRTAEHQYLGRYSIEKLHLVEHYQRTTSSARVLAVLLLTPLPTFLVLCAMDAVPLQPPRDGASANTVAFVRSALSHGLMTFVTLLPMKQALQLTDDEYPFSTIVGIAIATTLTNEALCIPLAFSWRFPVPFREMIGLPLWTTSVCIYNYLFAGRALRRHWRRLKLYVPIVGVQITLFYAFLALSVGFAYLSTTAQTIMILTFPLIKIYLKHLVWHYARRLDDLSTDVTICMLEIAGSLYQTVCMQFVASPILGALLLLTDVAQAVLEVRAYMKLDYLGDGKRTLLTASKIIQSSVFPGAEERPTSHTVASSTAPTRSMISTDHRDSLGGEAPDADTARPNSSSFQSEFSFSPLTRRSSRLPRESPRVTSSSMGGGAKRPLGSPRDTMSRPTRRGRRQAHSVYMAPQMIDRKAKRRLLNLDLADSEQRDSNGRVSNGRVASQQEVATNEAPAGRRPSMTNLPVPASAQLQRSHSCTVTVAATHPEPEPRTRGTYATPIRRRLRALQRLLPSMLFGSAASGATATVDLSNNLWRKSSATAAIKPSESEHTTGAQVHPVSSPAAGSESPSRSSRMQQYLAAPEATSDTAANADVAAVKRPRRRSKSRRSSAIMIDGILITRRDQARILEQTLQLMFACEVLLFVEYMEVVVPVLYALIVGGQWVLPNAQYNLVVMHMTVSGVGSNILTSVLYATLELASLLVMYWVMKTKYGISAFAQLAFVLESYWMTLQGKLVGSFIVIANAVTVHQGTDFSFQFTGA